MAKVKGKRSQRAKAPVRGKRGEKAKRLELDMADHVSRLKAIPSPSQDVLRQALLWVAAGVLLLALGWLAIGR
jgi:hypothetical protein